VAYSARWARILAPRAARRPPSRRSEPSQLEIGRFCTKYDAFGRRSIHLAALLDSLVSRRRRQRRAALANKASFEPKARQHQRAPPPLYPNFILFSAAWRGSTVVIGYLVVVYRISTVFQLL